MKIVIATPLWPPELGGPASYAKNLAKEFKNKGHSVEVVSFVKDILRVDPQDLEQFSFVSLKSPTGLRHLLFFCKLLSKLYRVDILLALDQFSVGLPAAMACGLLRKPLILRVEGDFLWESFVERTRKDITLREFYQRPQPLSAKEKFVKKITGWVIKKADILAFSSEWRCDMICRAFGVPKEKTLIIKNVWPRFVVLQPTNYNLQTKVVLWAGRMLYLKNLGRLIHAFARANDGSYELHLVGEGPDKENLELKVKSLKLEDRVKFFDPVSKEELAKLYRQASFFVLPSLSDVGPNAVAEAVAAKTPFIMTKESGYAEQGKNLGLLVDPLDEDDLVAKIKILMDDQKREEYRRRHGLFSSYRGWKEAAQDWLGLFLQQGRRFVK